MKKKCGYKIFLFFFFFARITYKKPCIRFSRFLIINNNLIFHKSKNTRKVENFKHL